MRKHWQTMPRDSHPNARQRFRDIVVAVDLFAPTPTLTLSVVTPDLRFAHTKLHESFFELLRNATTPQLPHRMSKRKRDDEDTPSTGKIHKDFRKLRQIVYAFNESAEQLAKAFKAAKGPERQKLGRRKKTAVAGKDAKEAERIDAEVAALKTLDALTAAQHFLAKSLMKIKAVNTSLELPSEIREPKPLPQEVATLNVNARLCNATGVKAVFPALAANVKREFGVVDKEEVVVPGKKKRLRKKDYEAAEKEGEEVAGRKAKGVEDDDLEDMAESDEQSDDEMDDYRGRLASSGDEGSDDDGLGETSDIGELERMLENEGISRKGSKRTKPKDRTAESSLSDSDSEPEPLEKKATTAKKSSFLPSLTMGGYISGSGSDLDSEMDIAPVKKNRRGQRARQAIWEKKYGAGAKHVKSKPAASVGWDAKRGAVEQKPHRFANAANAAPLGPRKGEKKEVKKRDDSGPLHPSWLAAKAAKEKKAIPVVFSGKKISFD